MARASAFQAEGRGFEPRLPLHFLACFAFWKIKFPVEKENTEISGEMPEWLKGADCKSAGLCLRGFESLSHHFLIPS
jgi:hypothetical protein